MTTYLAAECHRTPRTAAAKGLPSRRRRFGAVRRRRCARARRDGLDLLAAGQLLDPLQHVRLRSQRVSRRAAHLVCGRDEVAEQVRSRQRSAQAERLELGQRRRGRRRGCRLHRRCWRRIGLGRRKRGSVGGRCGRVGCHDGHREHEAAEATREQADASGASRTERVEAAALAADGVGRLKRELYTRDNSATWVKSVEDGGPNVLASELSTSTRNRASAASC